MKKTFLYAICILAALNCKEKTEEKLPVQEKLPAAKETPKPTGGNGKWSAYQGRMNWKDAQAKCASIKMRLPARAEIKAAYDAKLTEEWIKDLNSYYHWTSEEFSDDRAYLFNIVYGNSDVLHKNNSNFYYVRCIR